MRIEVNADDIEVSTTRNAGAGMSRCDACGVEIDTYWQSAHTVFDCLKELQRQIAELRGDK